MELPISQFAEVIIPLFTEGTFSYSIPEHFKGKIKPGMRVEVEFGKSKHYSAIVKKLSDTTTWEKTKPILDILDQDIIISSKQFAFWDWISSYYLCSLGDVMAAALPSSLKLASETKILGISELNYSEHELSDEEYLILEALEIRHELTIQDIRNILQKKTILKIVKKMLDRGLLVLHEQLQVQAEIPMIKWIKLHDTLNTDPNKLNEVLLQVQKNVQQSRALLTYIKERKNRTWIKQKELHQISGCASQVFTSLVVKNIFEEKVLEKYQYPELESIEDTLLLSDIQKETIGEIKNQWNEKNIVLLKGITGSGKTQIYLQLIKETIASGKQVLYLVPEIALTTQLVMRLRQFLGDQLVEYHSGLSPKNRLAIWDATQKGHPIIIGARSAIFLPFKQLGLIVIDEEHDSSYKQNDPNPRYNARDAALILAQDHNAKIILGSATPSVESYYNALQGRYGLVQLNQRFGDSQLPLIKLISLKEANQYGRMKENFSEEMIVEMKSQLDHGKQIIIFRNRRGYSPLIKCTNCQWEAMCDQCDIHLTLHKYQNRLKCHVCGIKKPIPTKCPQCDQYTIQSMGFGTEKIEEEIKELFPDHIVKRFDADTARSKNLQREIIEAFQDKEIHILIGTQMITKGFDFDHVGLVGILQADQMLFYPNFRAQERTFQLLTQVSGRSGRRDEIGKVLIQGYSLHHEVIQDVVNHDYERFYSREIEERKHFFYPPIVRFIRIEIRHAKIIIVEQAAEKLCNKLRTNLGKRILGPAEPIVSRIKGAYARELYVKLERKQKMVENAKHLIKKYSQELKNETGWSALRIIIDVDPY